MKELTSLPDLINFHGKLAIVTGASAGIGEGIAGRLAEAGADLILISRTKEDLDKVAEELKGEFGVNVQVFAIDLGVKAEIEKFWGELGDQVPDFLVNNAGFYPFSEFLETEDELYQKVLDVNLNSAYHMCFYFIKRLKEAKKTGNIVNIGSIEAVMPLKEGLIHYGISKAGVVALTRGLARDFGGDGIRANVILPGGVKTRGTSESAKEIFKLHFGILKEGYNFSQRLPLERLGRPDDIAKVALFLLSEMSSYMTGAVVPVDGGFLSS